MTATVGATFASLVLLLFRPISSTALSSTSNNYPRSFVAIEGDGGRRGASASAPPPPASTTTTTIGISRREAVTSQMLRHSSYAATIAASSTLLTIPARAIASPPSSLGTVIDVVGEEGATKGLASRLARRDPSVLKNSVFNVPPRPQAYPSFMRGSWDVNMKFNGFVFPSASITRDRLVSNYDVPGFQKLSIAMVGDVGRENASYVLNIDENTGLEDRRTSLLTSINSHLGYYAASDVHYDPRENPNRLSIDFVPNRTRNANRIELFCNARESDTIESYDPVDQSSSITTFVCSEHVRQVTFGLSTEYGVARQVSGNYAHFWTWRQAGRRRAGESGVASSDPNTAMMTGNLLTAAYLDAQDPMFFDEPSRPVVVYSHDLTALVKNK